jgi:hypothetical protein
MHYLPTFTLGTKTHIKVQVSTYSLLYKQSFDANE